MDAVILGRPYPMAYTVAAQSKLADRFGGIENIQTAFEAKGVDELMDNMAFMAAVLIQAAAERERVRCKIMGADAPDMQILAADEIKAAVQPYELKDVVACIMKTIQEGNAITVEVVPDQKKRKATPSK